jgi:hypothetical protein
MSEPHLGWFKVEESAVRKLRDTYDRQSAYRLALAVYVTLCRVANLEGRDTFTRRIASMGSDAGLSYNATAEGLELVKSAGLLTITAKTVAGSKERAPSEYQLVRMSPTECGTSPTENGRLPKSRNSQVLPRVSKNCTKNFNQEQHQERGATRRTRFVPPTVAEAEAEAEGIGMPKSEGQAFIDRHQTTGWVIGKAQIPMKDWRAAMRTWRKTYLGIQSGNSSKPKRSKPNYAV